MKAIFKCLITVGALSLVGCNHREDIPVIGLNSKNNPSQVFIPTHEYSKRVAEAAVSIQDSTIPMLNKQETHSSLWLRTVIFGVAVNTQIGVGPYQIGALPRFRMVFTNSSNPLNVP